MERGIMKKLQCVTDGFKTIGHKKDHRDINIQINKDDIVTVDDNGRVWFNNVCFAFEESPIIQYHFKTL